MRLYCSGGAIGKRPSCNNSRRETGKFKRAGKPLPHSNEPASGPRYAHSKISQTEKIFSALAEGYSTDCDADPIQFKAGCIGRAARIEAETSHN